jgi:hypothetical protein
MAQFARPDSDVALNGWSDPSWSVIDESAVDDGDFTQSALAPSNATLQVGLSDVEDPQSSSGHIVRYRYQKDAAGGAQINLTVALMQGGTSIASWSHTDIANGWVTQAQTLSGAQADSITNYANLRLHFTANQV